MDPCPCNDYPDVKDLLSLKATFEGNIQGEEDFIEEKIAELNDLLSKINEAIEKEIEKWDWKVYGAEIGGALTLVASAIISGGSIPALSLVGGGGVFSGYLYRENHPLLKELTLSNLNRVYALGTIIEHHEDFKRHWENKLQETIDELRDKCACALN